MNTDGIKDPAINAGYQNLNCLSEIMASRTDNTKVTHTIMTIIPMVSSGPAVKGKT